MPFNLPIPKELAHLKLDSRGYPIPYFVSYRDGEPEFRIMDTNRLQMIVERKVCHICGKKLPSDYCYFIAGPMGLKNKISTDAGMHRVCAEFSMKACPHLYLQKAERRLNDALAKAAEAVNPFHLPDKPDTLYLVKVDKWKQTIEEGRPFIHFRPVATEKYTYVEGKLLKAAE